MSRDPAVARLVAELVGVWSGDGEGRYPTIEPFRYREITEIEERPDHPALLFDQRAWREVPGGEVVSHWETGFLRISSDGTALLHNAQPGRVETMTGTWREEGSGWVISLLSTGFAGDIRMKAAARRLRLTPGQLSYEMEMETTSTGRLSAHLQATLLKGQQS